MENTSLIALSRQSVLRRQMDIVANNLANMNTTAYKGQRMMFIEQLVKSKGGERVLPEKLAFVRDIATVRELDEGPIQATGNTLDVAIRGEGYFTIDTPDGERYTRSGRFQLDSEGQLVTSHGFPVLSDAGQPFIFASTDTQIDIARDGTISTENGVLGRLRLVKFQNENDLKEAYGGLYATDQLPEDVAEPVFVQHAIEGSNVNPILEITRMIDVQRSYEAAKKLIDAEDERMKTAISELAKV